MLASSYLSDEYTHICSSVRYLGWNWGIEKAKKLLDEIAQDPDMTPAQKELQSYYFERLIEDCSKKAKKAKEAYDAQKKYEKSLLSTYDPFYRDPIEKRLWGDDFDVNDDFFNGQRIYYTDPETGERSVWGYDSMSS